MPSQVRLLCNPTEDVTLSAARRKLLKTYRELRGLRAEPEGLSPGLLAEVLVDLRSRTQRQTLHKRDASGDRREDTNVIHVSEELYKVNSNRTKSV